MKLIFCPKCQDVVRLIKKFRKCECGLSAGAYYADGLNAVITGAAIPVGIHGGFFINAVRQQPEEGMGKVFEAFVIPKVCPTVTVVSHENIQTLLHDLPESFNLEDQEFLVMNLKLTNDYRESLAKKLFEDVLRTQEATTAKKKLSKKRKAS